MSSESLTSLVLKAMLVIVRQKLNSAMSAIGNGAMLAANYVYGEQARAIVHGAVTTATGYAGEATKMASTFSFYDWVFYIFCFHIGICCFALVACMLKTANDKLPILNLVYCGVMRVLQWADNDMNEFMHTNLHRVYRLPTTLLVLIATTLFSVTHSAVLFVVNCLDNRTQASEEHGTNAVYYWVSTKAYELVTIMTLPYVYMYDIWMGGLCIVKVFVEGIFYKVVALCELLGNIVWYCISKLPLALFELVMSEPRRAYAALVAMKVRAAENVKHSPNDMTIYKDETCESLLDLYNGSLFVRVCFHVIHTVFLVSVHACTLYALYAYCTRTASIV
jgi:hypothetical protein